MPEHEPTELRPESELGEPRRGLLLLALILLVILGGLAVWAIFEIRHGVFLPRL